MKVTLVLLALVGVAFGKPLVDDVVKTATNAVDKVAGTAQDAVGTAQNAAGTAQNAVGAVGALPAEAIEKLKKLELPTEIVEKLISGKSGLPLDTVLKIANGAIAPGLVPQLLGLVNQLVGKLLGGILSGGLLGGVGGGLPLVGGLTQGLLGGLPVVGGLTQKLPLNSLSLLGGR